MSAEFEVRAPPAGFARHFRRSGVTDPWEPIYSCVLPDKILLGLWSGPAHANSRGFVHGAVMTPLADNAMGLSCSVHFKSERRLVTLNLTMDFMRPAKQGQWIEADTSFVKTGASVCFAHAFVTADGVPCARANATFMAPEPRPEASSHE